MAKSFAALALAAVALAAAPAAATTIIRSYEFSAPEYNGDGEIGEVVIAAWVFALMPDERIVAAGFAAGFASAFGNSVAGSSATGAVSVGPIEVGRCDGPGEPCWDGPGSAIAYSFEPGEFASLTGLIRLTYDQTDCCVIRLGPSVLAIRTEQTVVPEPAAWAMMVAGFGLIGGILRRGRTGKAAQVSQTVTSRSRARYARQVRGGTLMR